MLQQLLVLLVLVLITRDKGVIELAPVIYDTPITQHTFTTQHNVAYGGTIPLKHNEAYQQL